ncbi:MAG: DUF975 family protein [Oscillospiraceae bacterium]|nr:DUF975 family protein [Oscillospiraceae bacterium]
MTINRSALKLEARDIIRQSQQTPVKILYASIIFVALNALISFLSTRLTGVSYSALNRYMRYVENGDWNRALSYMGSIAPSPSARLLDLALHLVTIIVGVGFTVFLFNHVRKTEPAYGNLLDGFGSYLRLAVLELVTSFFVALWSLLLVVPGIIALYRYRFAPYIMLDHPEMSIMDCIRESKRMTQGYKGQLFTLDLSFIGWALLAALPYAGYVAEIFLIPYFTISQILFYDQVRQAEQAARFTPYA